MSFEQQRESPWLNFTLLFTVSGRRKAGVGRQLFLQPMVEEPTCRRAVPSSFRKLLERASSRCRANEAGRIVSAAVDVTQRHFYSRLLISVGETGPVLRGGQAPWKKDRRRFMQRQKQCRYPWRDENVSADPRSGA